MATEKKLCKRLSLQLREASSGRCSGTFRTKWEAEVHEICARGRLSVSSTFSRDAHRRAVSIAKTPVKQVSKSAVASRRDELLPRVILVEKDLKSRAVLFDRAGKDEVLSVLVERERLHGLVGNESSRTRKAERDLFRPFVHRNRTLTGRTSDKSGRPHGAVYHLDARWDVPRKDLKNPQRSSFCMDSLTAFKPVSESSIAERTVYEWFHTDFGTRMNIDGTKNPSTEHTTLYPQKTDACATYEVLRADIRSNEKILRRHRKRSERTLLCLQAIA